MASHRPVLPNSEWLLHVFLEKVQVSYLLFKFSAVINEKTKLQFKDFFFFKIEFFQSTALVTEVLPHKNKKS